MKAIYFLNNGIATPEDVKRKKELRMQGYKVIFSNGNAERGFEDSCEAIYLAGDFPLIKTWAESKGITIIGDAQKSKQPEVAAVEPEQKQEEPTEKPARRGRSANQQ